jgi:hypothetical protein
MPRSWANAESTKYWPCLQAHYSSLGPARELNKIPRRSQHYNHKDHFSSCKRLLIELPAMDQGSISNCRRRSGYYRPGNIIRVARLCTLSINLIIVTDFGDSRPLRHTQDVISCKCNIQRLHSRKKIPSLATVRLIKPSI